MLGALTIHLSHVEKFLVAFLRVSQRALLPSSTEKKRSPTEARHTAPGKTQNTPGHRHRTANNTHRPGTTGEQPTTQHKRKPAPAGAQGPQQHTPAHPTAQDTQVGASTAEPAHQVPKEKAGAEETNSNQTKNKSRKRKSRGGGEKGKKKKKTNGGTGREDHRTPRPTAPQAGNHGTPRTRRRTRKKKEKNGRKKRGGAGQRTTRRQGPRQPGPADTEREREQGRNKEKKKRKKRKNKNTTTTKNRAAPAQWGPNKPRAHQGRPQKKRRRTKTRQGGPARQTRPRRARTRTRTHARDSGVASSAPKGAVSASTRNSPGAAAESPIKRRTVRETGSVSDRVHKRKKPKRTQPKTDTGGTRQGKPHGGAPNGYDAERAQSPSLGGGQRQAQRVRFSAAQAPSKPGDASPWDGERHHSVGKADRGTEGDRTRRGATHQRGAGGTPERHAAGHNQGKWTGAKQQQPSGAPNLEKAHNTQRTTAQAQVPENAKPTHHKPPPGVAGYKRSAHKNTHTPTPQPGVAGRSQNLGPSTHTHAAHPSQEWRGKSGAGTRTHKQPNTPARIGVAQPKPKPKHTHPRRSQEWRGTSGARTQTCTPQHSSQEWRGAAQNPSPNTHNHTAHPSQEWRGTSEARIKTHTPQHPSQEWRGAAKTWAQAHTPTLHTPARSGGVKAERAHEHTNSPTPQPGSAWRSRNPSPSTHIHAAARSGGVQAERVHKRAHPNTPARSGGAQPKTRAQTHTTTPHTPARSGGVQAERAHTHTHPNTPARSGAAQPKPEPKHTRPGRTSQPGVGGTSAARTQAHTHPNTRARSGGLQPKPEPKHTHPHLTPQQGLAGYKRSTHTNTHTQTPQPGVAGRSRNPSPNANDPARNHPRQSARRDEHARSTSTRHARRSSRPPPKRLQGGGTQLKRLRYVKLAGRAQAALPALPAPPWGSHRARGGTRSLSATSASRTPGRTRTSGGGSAASPPPLPPLPGAGRHFRGHLSPADGGTGGVISQRRGHRPPPGGREPPPRGGAGSGGSGRTPPKSFGGAARRGQRRRWGTPQGGDRRCRLTAIPQGTALGGAAAATSATRAEQETPPRGSHRTAGRVPTPRGRSGRGAKGWGSRGAPCRPCAMSTGPQRASHAKGTGGYGIAAAATTKGIPGFSGGGQRCLPVQRGGLQLQQQASVLPSGGSAVVPAPMIRGEGGGPTGQGTAASPWGGTQGPGQGHGRASEEGT